MPQVIVPPRASDSNLVHTADVPFAGLLEPFTIIAPFEIKLLKEDIPAPAVIRPVAYNVFVLIPPPEAVNRVDDVSVWVDVVPVQAKEAICAPRNAFKKLALIVLIAVTLIPLIVPIDILL